MSDTESFESVINESFEIARAKLQIAFEGKLFERLLSDLQAAHEREIRDTAQQQYHRGYDDGRHSMDAEHRAIAMRLRALPLDGGSHENLSQIARAVYHSDFGWTKGACVALRDELVRLMGGVSDENVHVGGLRCVDGCRGDVPNGEDTGRTYDAPSNRVRNHMAVREGVATMIGDSDDAAELTTTDEFITFIDEDTRRLKGDASKVGDGNDTCDSQCRGACAADCGRDSGKHEEVEHGGAAHDCADDSRGGSCGELVHMDGLSTYNALDNERQKAVRELRRISIEAICEKYDEADRCPEFMASLARAIGLTHIYAFELIINRLIYLLCGDQPSGSDVLREMDAESDDNGTCPNDDPTSSITDELREWASDRHCKGMSHTDALNIGLIADRIDEQFDRICAQQEAVLQSTIDEMVKECDHWKQAVGIKAEMLLEISGENVSLKAECEKLEKQRDELRRKVDELESFDPETSIAEFGDDNGKLRRTLSRAATLLANAEQDRDANYAYWMDCKEKVVHANATIEELQAKLEEYEQTRVKLPAIDSEIPVSFIGQSVEYVGGYGGDDTIESAARTCTQTKNGKSAITFVKNLVKRGHMSPTEFGYADFLIECDRAIQQELTRHRLFDFNIESTRLIDYRRKPLRFVTKPPAGWNVPSEAIELLEQWCELAAVVYEALLALGADRDYARKAFPLALASKVRMAGNSRVWYEMLGKRIGRAVHPEAREVATEARRSLEKRFVGLFTEGQEE